MMIGIDHKHFPKLPTCLTFMRNLATEQSVFVFPGECFNFPGFFRIVLTTPKETLVEACKRMKEFCEKYYED
jgi:tyrosine aminotransferase